MPPKRRGSRESVMQITKKAKVSEKRGDPSRLGQMPTELQELILDHFGLDGLLYYRREPFELGRLGRTLLNGKSLFDALRKLDTRPFSASSFQAAVQGEDEEYRARRAKLLGEYIELYKRQKLGAPCKKIGTIDPTNWYSCDCFNEWFTIIYNREIQPDSWVSMARIWNFKTMSTYTIDATDFIYEVTLTETTLFLVMKDSIDCIRLDSLTLPPEEKSLGWKQTIDISHLPDMETLPAGFRGQLAWLSSAQEDDSGLAQVMVLDTERDVAIIDKDTNITSNVPYVLATLDLSTTRGNGIAFDASGITGFSRMPGHPSIDIVQVWTVAIGESKVKIGTSFSLHRTVDRYAQLPWSRNFWVEHTGVPNVWVIDGWLFDLTRPSVTPIDRESVIWKGRHFHTFHDGSDIVVQPSTEESVIAWLPLAGEYGRLNFGKQNFEDNVIHTFVNDYMIVHHTQQSKRPSELIVMTFDNTVEAVDSEDLVILKTSDGWEIDVPLATDDGESDYQMSEAMDEDDVDVSEYSPDDNDSMLDLCNGRF